MKGFTHFVAGLAVSSFFPWSIQAAQEGNPLYFLIGGTMAILPDTFDFRIIRYFYHHDVEVTPDPLDPDMQMVANAIAQTIDQSAKRKMRLRLNTIRVDTDLWQKYSVCINPKTHTVTASREEQIDTGGNPEPHSVPNKHKTATAFFSTPVSLEYLAKFPVEIFDGPHLQMRPDKKGNVSVGFIPWHRQYTHSICVSMFLACIAAACGHWKAGCIMFAAHASHVLLDQIGYMGSNLFWPILHNRYPGLKLQHASSAFWNTAAVWIAIAAIYSNLHSHAEGVPHIPVLGYIILVVAAPLFLLKRWLGARC